MNGTAPYSIYSLGDSAITIDFGDTINVKTNEQVLLLFQRLKELKQDHFLDLIPAYSTLTVVYDPICIASNGRTAFDKVTELVSGIISNLDKEDRSGARQLNIPVCYSNKFGPDLEEISVQKRTPVEEIIRIHTAGKYRVYMIGFLPGFPYMGEVDDVIATPRKAIPRLSVAAGSVGIAGKQTGIYPLESPGGWQIIGRTPVTLFDKNRKDGVLFQPGDEITFYSITEDEFKDYQDRRS